MGPQAATEAPAAAPAGRRAEAPVGAGLAPAVWQRRQKYWKKKICAVSYLFGRHHKDVKFIKKKPETTELNLP